MKIRILPIAVTAAVSLLLLFGGWFLYRQTALERPIERMLSQYPGVTSAQVDITQKQAVLKLDLESNVDLRGMVAQLRKEEGKLLKNRTVVFDIADHSTPEIDALWKEASFSVAEAMANKRYTLIPNTLSKIQDENVAYTISSDMDDHYIYVVLSSSADKQANKYVILPLTASQGTGGQTNA
ncbi:heavy metal-associated domain-containing protein [Saccharibacillus sp. CPCC 101409]|uniref:heavy-metal-associated domain-containing protein n=1 Tax=Saccharibacillus sp. CPCC 101409 TaxID=3058041 RepID=UPI002672CE65|nr:heavy metal-associated domain-containing protein [Saccharibacillus sp. CPCC 101409]MDO3409647.1 heavy metal-associated domain-containing protein [Saccharibacillus sp. CPCC 101409]